MEITKTRDAAADNEITNDAVDGAEMAAAAPGTATPTTTRPGPTQIAGGVWPALMGNPGATAADLATSAGVAKGTARRALIALEAEGYATRTPGGHIGGKRTPDTWHASTDTGPNTDTETAADISTPDDPAPNTGESPPATAPADTSEAPTDNRDEADDEEEGDAMEEAAVTEAREALTDLSTVLNTAMEAMNAEDRATALTAAEAIYMGSGKTRRLIRAAANGRPRSASGKARSHPGELRAKIADHLTAHPGTEFTPHEIGKAIGHSAGAVANALDRLVALEEAALTCDRPRRYTATAHTTETGTDAKDASAATT